MTIAFMSAGHLSTTNSRIPRHPFYRYVMSKHARARELVHDSALSIIATGPDHFRTSAARPSIPNVRDTQLSRRVSRAIQSVPCDRCDGTSRCRRSSALFDDCIRPGCVGRGRRRRPAAASRSYGSKASFKSTVIHRSNRSNRLFDLSSTHSISFSRPPSRPPTRRPPRFEIHPHLHPLPSRRRLPVSHPTHRLR